jgi:hypothetical protein
MKILKALNLPNRDRSLLLQAGCCLIVVRLGLWSLPFQTLQNLLFNRLSLVLKSAHHQVPIDKIVWAVNTTSRYMPGQVKCLARALTTKIVMKQQGYTAELRIGVRRSQTGQLEAHAWIEYQGEVIIGQLHHLVEFTPLPSLRLNP